MRQYRFKEQLDLSQSADTRRRWDAVYRRFWPGVTEIKEVHNLDLQRHGVDVIIKRGLMPALRIEEKSTAKDSDDLFVELWSVWRGEDHPGNRKGWSVRDDMLTDWLAYGWKNHCLLIPWSMYRAGVRRGLDASRGAWRARYPACDVPNQGYKTRGLWVPRRELLTQAVRSLTGRWAKEEVVDADALTL